MDDERESTLLCSYVIGIERELACFPDRTMGGGRERESRRERERGPRDTFMWCVCCARGVEDERSGRHFDIARERGMWFYCLIENRLSKSSSHYLFLLLPLPLGGAAAGAPSTASADDTAKALPSWSMSVAPYGISAETTRANSCAHRDRER